VVWRSGGAWGTHMWQLSVPRAIIRWRRISKAASLWLGAPAPPICGLFVYNLNKSAKASAGAHAKDEAAKGSVVNAEWAGIREGNHLETIKDI